MGCELCGKETPTSRAVVEGVELNVCKSCAGFGKTVTAPLLIRTPPIRQSAPQRILAIIPRAGAAIRQARERLGLSQKDFALRLNEHQSVIHKLETGHLSLTIDLARKLEKALHIRLIEEHTETPVAAQKTSSGPVTIGDLVKLKE